MKKENKLPIKNFYDIKMEVLLPATIVYRVSAEDAEKALEEVRVTTQPSQVKYDLSRRKIKKVTVYDAGCSIIKHIKVVS